MTKEEIFGKSVVGMLKIFDEKEELTQVIEIVGQIMSVDEKTGILICNHDTEKAVSLPYALDAFKPAKEGYYALQTGAKVKNPDLICTMAIQRKESN